MAKAKAVLATGLVLAGGAASWKWGAVETAAYLWDAFRSRWHTIAWIVAAFVAVYLFFTKVEPFKRHILPRAHRRGKRLSARREARRLKTYPPAFPNSWYKVANASDVKRGGVLYVEACGRDLAVFRGQNDGLVKCLDAICPHMGANLAVGGAVVGDCIQCPFHLWEFAGDGKCEHIPYADVPSAAKTKAYPVVEWCGVICFYFDAEGRDPPYPLPDDLPIYTAPSNWVFRGEYSENVHMHIIEFAENSADFQHFQPLHGKMMIPFTSWHLPFITIDHRADWVLNDEPGREHLAYFKDYASLRFMGKPIEGSAANATITFVGPGGVVYFLFETPLGKILVLQTHTPLEPMLNRTDFRWWSEKSVPRLLTWYVVGNWISQWSRDEFVWENKYYANRPLLVKGDGPVFALRAWYRQFYSESSEAVSREAGASTGTLEW